MSPADEIRSAFALLESRLERSEATVAVYLEAMTATAEFLLSVRAIQQAGMVRAPTTLGECALVDAMLLAGEQLQAAVDLALARPAPKAVS